METGSINLDDFSTNLLLAKDRVNLGNDAKVVCVYFSAHWCPPCRNFTPKLAEFYKNCNKELKQLDIIFVTSDRDKKSFEEYYETMPWHAIEFGNEGIAKLKTSCQVKYIPKLCILKNGKFKEVDRTIFDQNDAWKVLLNLKESDDGWL